MKKLRHLTSFFILALCLIVSILVYNKWFFGNDIFTWGDWGFFFKETLYDFLSLPSAWLSGFNFGIFDIGLSQYLTRFLIAFISKSLDFSIASKLVYFWSSVIISTVSVFIFVKHITKSTIAAVVGYIVYFFNTYILLINTGHFTLAISFAISPLIFLLFQNALKNRSIKYSILTGLVGFLATSYEIRAFFLTSIILFLYFVYTCVIDRPSLKDILKLSMYAILPMLIIGLLNSYWIIGIVRTPSILTSQILNRQLYGAGHVNIQRAFMLFHQSWTGDSRISWGDIQPTPPYFWIIPFLAMGGFWVNRKNREILFWGIISIIGVFLAKQTGEPFTHFYIWLYNYFPGFGAFRESSKFFFFISLSYSVLIGSLFSWLWKQKISRIFKIVILLITIMPFLYNSRPVVTGELGKLLTPRFVPEDYLILKKFIQDQPSYFRTLFTPNDSKWGYWDSIHPKLGLANLLRYDWYSLNHYKKTGLEYHALEETMSILEQSYSSKLLDQSAIKYVIIPSNDMENEEIFIYSKDVPRYEIIDRIKQLKFIKNIDIGTKELLVFENPTYRPHLYTIRDTKELLNDTTYTPVSYNKISEAEYSLLTPFESNENYLLFSEAYHQGWRIHLGQFVWWKSLVDKNYFLPGKNHLRTEFGLNKFTISKVSPDTKVTLYFFPQAWVNLGVIISVSTLGISLIILALIWQRNNH